MTLYYQAITVDNMAGILRRKKKIQGKLDWITYWAC